MMQHLSIPSSLVAAFVVAGFIVGGVFGQADSEDDDRPESVEAVVEAPKTNAPAARPESPAAPKSKTAKPPPAFEATEEVPVDMAVDFPSDI